MISGVPERTCNELRGDITGEVSLYDGIFQKELFEGIRDIENRFLGAGEGRLIAL
jgi:hypothetical protein